MIDIVQQYRNIMIIENGIVSFKSIQHEFYSEIHTKHLIEYQDDLIKKYREYAMTFLLNNAKESLDNFKVYKSTFIISVCYSDEINRKYIDFVKLVYSVIDQEFNYTVDEIDKLESMLKGRSYTIPSYQQYEIEQIHYKFTNKMDILHEFAILEFSHIYNRINNIMVEYQNESHNLFKEHVLE